MDSRANHHRRGSRSQAINSAERERAQSVGLAGGGQHTELAGFSPEQMNYLQVDTSGSRKSPLDSSYYSPSGAGGSLAEAARHMFSQDCPANSDLSNSSSQMLANDCNSTTSNRFMLMNFRTDEWNFSDIKEVWLVKGWPEILLRVSFVAPIVLLGLIGNLTIIYSMCRFKPIRSKPTNIFILNMALADLITTIVVPNAALLTDIYQFYILGPFLCRFEGFIKITCLLVSAYSLIVLSFDWFLSVVKPCRTRMSIKQTWLTLVTIWLVSVAMALPLLYWRHLRQRQWKDLVEIWCCELIQYTKYYWVGMTLFLIYLPTVVMTIVLVVILVQMDKFEAKLKRTRQCTTPMSSIAGARTRALPTAATPAPAPANNPAAPNGLVNLNNNSLSISMKYRRRILKILFFYLLTSIVCWSPFQFVIVYRHFRTEAVPANWFFELAFYSQLCASLSAAMNPIIFGFLSQPFRRVVTKSWMFRFLDKVWATKGTRTRSDQNVKNVNFVMDNRQNNRPVIGNNNNYVNHTRTSQRCTGALEQPKLTAGQMDTAEGRQASGRAGASDQMRRHASNASNHARPHRARAGSQHNQQHNHHHHQHHGHNGHTRGQQQVRDRPNIESFSQSTNQTGRTKIYRSHSSRHSQALEDGSGSGGAGCNKQVSYNKSDASIKISSACVRPASLSALPPVGRANRAYLTDGADETSAATPVHVVTKQPGQQKDGVRPSATVS